MAESIFSGALKFQYDDAGNSYGSPIDLYPCKSDSEDNPEQPSDDVTTEGDILFAGEFKDGVIRCYDMSKYAALRTIQKADGKIDLRKEDLGENFNPITEGFIPRVMKPDNFAPGQRRYFELRYRKFTID